MELCIIGLNHRTTPLEFREQFSVPADHLPRLLGQLREAAGLDEVLVISTCNRLEIYAVKMDGPIASDRLLDVLVSLRGADSGRANLRQVEQCLYLHRNEACVQHLFRVASSLDSLVVGETEIVGQVKKAYQLAQSCGMTGRTLNRLFQKALSVSKQVRTRSGIGRCSTSIGSVALDLAMKIFGDDLRERTILIIGAGKMSETTLKHLSKHGVRSILVANRSYDRAVELVAEFNAQAVPFSNLADALVKADIVVSSTSAPGYVLGREQVATALSARPDRPLLLIDLAVPRDIDPTALELHSAFLYNIDQLSELARLNLERRQTEAAACETLVAEYAQGASALLFNPFPCLPHPLRRPAAAPRVPQLEFAGFGCV